MNQARSLRKLNHVASRRVRRLTSIAIDARLLTSCERNRTAAYVTLELVNTWSQFVRSYVVSCILGAHSPTGIITTNSVATTVPDALLDAKRVFVPSWSGPLRRREEPIWHDPQTLVRIAQRLRFSNLAQISSALSTGTRTFSDMPVFRNFFAHRNRDSAYTALHLARTRGIYGVRHPVVALYSFRRGASQELVFEFCDDVATAILLLC